LTQLRTEHEVWTAYYEQSEAKRLYDAQGKLSRMGVAMMIGAVVLAIGLLIAIGFRAWAVGTSLLGMSVSLVLAGYVSFVVGAADGVCAEMHSYAARRAVSEFVDKNLASDTDGDRVNQQIAKQAAQVFWDTVFGITSWQFKEFQALLHFMRLHRYDVLIAGGLVLLAQLFILLLKVGVIREHLIFFWAAAVLQYCVAWLVFRFLRSKLAEHVQAASSEVERNLSALRLAAAARHAV
jgi:hypothetical protein